MFTVLLDAPAKASARLQIAKLGTFEDPRYGEFAITAETVANWQKNLSKLPGGEALIDFEHRSERKPRDSKAAGWISGIDLDGDKVMADARWTPDGKQAITDESYRFLSPVFGRALGADNEQLDDALPSVALTNKPVLGMPALSLASQERVSAALDEDPALRFHMRALDGDLGEQVQALVMLDVSQADRDKAKAQGNSLPDGSYPISNISQLKAAATLAASKHGDYKAALKLIRRRARELGVDVRTLPGFSSKSLDSRPPAMQTDLLKTLGLDEDSDLVTALEAVELSDEQSQKILDAATALKDKADKEPEKPELKTLEQQAQDAGLVVLDAAAVTKLQLDAAAGADASKKLHEQRFETAFTEALKDKRGPRVMPADKDTLHRFFTLDADAAIKHIEALEPRSRPQPSGDPAIELDLDAPADPQAVANAGIHPGSHETYRKVQSKLKALDKPQSEFSIVLAQMMEDGEL